MPAVDLCLLAAGGGTRLRPLTERLPKALMPLRSGGTVIERLLERATSELDVAGIVVVVGYRAEDIRARLGDSFRGMPIRYAENAEWATTPNAESVVRAAPWLGSRPTLLMDGDLVVAPGGLKLALPDDADLLLVTDSEAALDAEAMKVILDGQGRITALRKEAAGSAEFIGISLWRDIRPLIEAIRSLPPARVHYYEDGINRLLESGKLRVARHEIDAFTWVEIDTEDDYRRATKLDLDWSPYLMRVVAERCRAGDAVVRDLLAHLGRGSLGRIGAGPSLVVGALLAAGGIALVARGWPLLGILLALAAQAGGMAEHYPDQSPRLLRLARFLDRFVDLALPVALASAVFPAPEALLAAAVAATVLFLYYFTGISYLLIIPRSSFLANPVDLQRMNRAWLDRGVILSLDRGGLFLVLSLFAAILPIVPALLIFTLAAFLLWAWQSLRLWRLIRA